MLALALPLQSSDLGAPARPAGRPAPRAAAPAASKAAAPRTSAPAAAAAAPVEEDENALSCGSLSKADAQEQLASVFGEDITAQLQDAAWKVRAPISIQCQRSACVEVA